MPRSTTWSSSEHRRHRSARPNLAFRIWWKSREPERDDARRMRAAGARHRVAAGELAELAPVDGEHDAAVARTR